METRVVHAKVKKRLTEIACRICVVQYSRTEVLEESVLQTQRVHPFPFRTRKLSSAVATILCGRLHGKIAQCRHGREDIDVFSSELTKRDGERTTFYEKETGASSGSRRTRRKNSGGVAQLGEHLPCKQGVMSSNLIISTNPGKPGNRLRVSGSSEDGSPKEENQGRDTTNCIGS